MINDAMLAAWAPRMLSVLRIMTALLFLQHGLSKFFAWPAAAPANFQVMSLIGFAAAIELIGGVLLAAGLFTRIAAVIMSGEMAFAYFMGHAGQSFFPQVNRGEAAIMFCFIFLYVAIAGGGPWGIDAARKAAK
ncbi:MAG: DoxX family protein [Alphaproteobacteria bacterium]|nr:DoxX family protein [Alphaproteobacteria bacterium]